jgi:hypothetical protein
MKPKIIRFESSGADYLSIIKNGIIIDIACSDKDSAMISEEDQILKKSFNPFCIKVRAKDLALYTHWPRHTKEFWDLLNET